MVRKRGPIPTKDADFNSYINQAIPYLGTNKTRLRVSSPNISALNARRSDWNVLYPKTQDSTQRTTSLTEQKNELREEIEELLRAVYDDILESALTTEDRNKLNLSKRDSELTAAVVPNWSPTAAFDRISNRMHILRISNPEDPESKAKPDGVDSVEVYRFIGDTEPANDSDYIYIGDAREHLYESKFEVEHQGKRAWYMLRYKSTRGDKGPWSEAINEHIA